MKKNYRTEVVVKGSLLKDVFKVYKENFDDIERVLNSVNGGIKNVNISFKEGVAESKMSTASLKEVVRKSFNLISGKSIRLDNKNSSDYVKVYINLSEETVKSALRMAGLMFDMYAMVLEKVDFIEVEFFNGSLFRQKLDGKMLHSIQRMFDQALEEIEINTLPEGSTQLFDGTRVSVERL